MVLECRWIGASQLLMPDANSGNFAHHYGNDKARTIGIKHDIYACIRTAHPAGRRLQLP